MPKEQLKPGTRIAIPLLDRTWVAAQVLDWFNKGAFRCVMYDLRDASTEIVLTLDLQNAHPIGTAIVLRSRIDNNKWPIGGVNDILFPRKAWPYENTASTGWVGAKLVDAVLFEAFANAYFGLTYWDDFHDPNYLDRFLIAPCKRPSCARFKSQ